MYHSIELWPLGDYTRGACRPELPSGPCTVPFPNPPCEGLAGLLDGAAHADPSFRLSLPPPHSSAGYKRTRCHGCSETQDVALAPGYAAQPSGSTARSPCGVRKLRRTETASSRMQ